jgi:hypothetical protein
MIFFYNSSNYLKIVCNIPVLVIHLRLPHIHKKTVTMLIHNLQKMKMIH